MRPHAMENSSKAFVPNRMGEFPYNDEEMLNNPQAWHLRYVKAMGGIYGMLDLRNFPGLTDSQIMDKIEKTIKECFS